MIIDYYTEVTDFLICILVQFIRVKQKDKHTFYRIIFSTESFTLEYT